MRRIYLTCEFCGSNVTNCVHNRIGLNYIYVYLDCVDCKAAYEVRIKVTKVADKQILAARGIK